LAELAKDPRGWELEDFVAAHFVSRGCYVETGVKERALPAQFRKGLLMFLSWWTASCADATATLSSRNFSGVNFAGSAGARASRAFARFASEVARCASLRSSRIPVVEEHRQAERPMSLTQRLVKPDCLFSRCLCFVDEVALLGRGAVGSERNASKGPDLSQNRIRWFRRSSWAGEHYNPPFHSHAGFFAQSEPWSSAKPRTARAPFWPKLSFAFEQSSYLTQCFRKLLLLLKTRLRPNHKLSTASEVTG